MAMGQFKKMEAGTASCEDQCYLPITNTADCFAVQLAYFFVCCWPCPGPLFCTGTTLSPVSAVQLAYLFVCCWLGQAPKALKLNNVKTLEQNHMRFMGCVYNSGTDTMMFGEHGTNDVWKTWHHACMCKTSLSNVTRALLDEHCLTTSELLIDCPVDAADNCLQNYLKAYQVPNQTVSMVASFGYVVLSFAGGFPDLKKARNGGKLKQWATWLVFIFWTLLQLATSFFLVLAILIVFLDYASATSILSQCMVRIGSASVLHLVATTGFFLLPAVTTKIFALCLTLMSLVAGFRGNDLIWWNPDMLVYIAFIMFLLLAFLPAVWCVFTGSFIFSIMTIPIPIITLIVLVLTRFIIQQLNNLFAWANNENNTNADSIFWLGKWREGKLPTLGAVIYAMLIWICVAPWVSSSYLLAFVVYQKGAGAPYNQWLHDVFTYLFADGFPGIYLELPDAMNFLESFSNLASLPEVMEKLTELTGSFYEVDPSMFYDEAGRLGSISLAFSLLKAIAVAANLIINLKCNLGFPMTEVGTVLLASTTDEEDKEGLGAIEESGHAVPAIKQSVRCWPHLSEEMKKDPDVIKELDLQQTELTESDALIISSGMKDNPPLKATTTASSSAPAPA